MKGKHQAPCRTPRLRSGDGFTIVELLVVIAVIAILASLILPVLAKAKARGQAISCLNNLRQLNIAWLLYAHDNNDRLVYNLGATEIKQMLARGQHLNWANSVLNWELDADNTNTTLNTQSGLGVYVAQSMRVFQCPADHVVSAVQKRAGWNQRSRSISMNAMVGDAGEFIRTGTNVNNPTYRQFLKLGDVNATSDLFVFIEEHPDSINDGYFLNKASAPGWTDLPASYHNGSANLSFADGHAEFHSWILASTKPPSEPDAARLPSVLPDSQRTDYYWVLRRTSTYTPVDD